MSIQFFTDRDPGNAIIRLPAATRRTLRWLPRIGDHFPDFTLDTTQGELRFRDWAQGSWTHLFSHPAALTPVCTTEIASLASHAETWEKLNVKHLGISASPVEDQLIWHDHVSEIFEVDIGFPIGYDPMLTLCKLFGMIHDEEATCHSIRKSFVLDPDLRIALVMEYPVHVGRNTAELIRVIEALQLVDATGVATPADWMPGDVALVPDDRSETEVLRQFGSVSRRMMSYLRVVDPGRE